jgi:energy-coupling factor transporter ATP-binding protein EcfA2
VPLALDKVAVKSFRSLVDVEVPLGRVNVFIGANGSGKSNLLEAIGVLGAAAAGRVDDSALKERGVRPGVEKLYKSSFRNLKLPSFIHLVGTSGSASYSVGLWNPLAASIITWRYHSESLRHVDGRVTGRSARSQAAPNPDVGLIALSLVGLPAEAPESVLVRALQGFRIYSPVTHFLRYSNDPTQQDPIGLLGGGLGFAVAELFDELRRKLGEDEFATFLRAVHALIGWADQIKAIGRSEAPLPASVTSGREVLLFRDRFMARGRDTLTAHDASEGALYVLFGLVVALHPRSPRLAAIDNFDQALNPALAKTFTRFLCTWSALVAPDRQLLLTCHNPLVLDGLPLRDDPTIRLLAVERDNTGRTVIRHLDLRRLLETKKDNPAPLSRLWVMGALGAIPSNV